MNVERLRELADHIEGLDMGPRRPHLALATADIYYLREIPKMFNMTGWFYEKEECGTVGCIAGHAAALFALDPYRDRTGHKSISDVAMVALGLDDYEASGLFTPPIYLPNITPKQAARVLRLVADGENTRDAWNRISSE